MKIQFPCRKCQTTLAASEEKAGRQGKCPKCGTPFVVPTPPPLDLDEDLPVAAVVAPATPAVEKRPPVAPVAAKPKPVVPAQKSTPGAVSSPAKPAAVPNRLAMGTPVELKPGETLVPAKLLGPIPAYLAQAAAAAARSQGPGSPRGERLPKSPPAEPLTAADPLATASSASLPSKRST